MKPNLVYIVVDQWRRAAANYWNEEPFQSGFNPLETPDPVFTPNIDKLAKQSRVFTHATAMTALCSPSRGMMFSGQLPHRNGITLNCNTNRPNSYLREDTVCISDLLSKEGYSLGYIGKLHTDFPTPNVPHTGGYAEDPRPDGFIWDAYTEPGPKRHGFDYWYSYGAFDQHLNPHYWDTDGNYHEPKEWSPDHEAKVATSYIRNENGQRDADKPFALYVSINPPHNPYEQCLDHDLEHYKGKTVEELKVRDNASLEHPVIKNHIHHYFAMVTGVDRAVGAILKALEESGHAENTLFILTSDHGESLGSHRMDSKNHPYAESVDVPLLVRFPGVIEEGKVDDLLISTCDMTPTVLGLLGFKELVTDEMDGSDFSEHLSGAAKAETKPVIYFRNVNDDLDENGVAHGYCTNMLGLKTHTHSFWISASDIEPHTIALFDNIADPYQLNNLLDSENCEELKDEYLGKLRDSLPARFDRENLHSTIQDLLGLKG